MADSNGKLAAHVPGGRYSLEEKERGLLAIALYGGNTRRAAEDLAARGIPIPRDTLKDWKIADADRLAEIRASHIPRIRDRQATECEETAAVAGEVERAMFDRLHGEVPEIALRDLAGAVRNVAVAKGINLDHSAKLRGEPTQIIQHNVSEDLSWLVRHGVIDGDQDIGIEGTAVEESALQDAELAEGGNGPGASYPPRDARPTHTREDHELSPGG